LLYAAANDVLSYTIPNWLCLTLAAIFPFAALASGENAGLIGAHLAFAVAILALGFALFQFNILGGGDAKLLAAAALWTGLEGFKPFLLGTALVGGLLALALVTARQFVPRAANHPAFVSRLLQKQDGIPYGVAILGGGILALQHLPFDFTALTLP
jgi:prepilin peptidase CpaA